MKIHSTTITSSLSDQFQSLAKVSLRYMISLVDRDAFAKYAALLIVGNRGENRREKKVNANEYHRGNHDAKDDEVNVLSI